jgi:hypothetical protein
VNTAIDQPAKPGCLQRSVRCPTRRLTEEQVRETVRKCMGKGSQKDMASVLRVSPQYLNDFLKGRREPGPSILKELGLRREVRYVDI